MKSTALLFAALLAIALLVVPTGGQAQTLAVTALHQFGAAADGNDPSGQLSRGADGNFYGTTLRGGTAGLGTIYQLTPGGQLTILHSFTATEGISASNVVEGIGASTGVVRSSDGSLYGAVTDLVYKLATDGTLTTLSSIGSGSITTSLQLGRDGNLYGTRKSGFSDVRSVYKLTLSGTFTILQDFDSLNPGLVQATDGQIYGTTPGDPSNSAPGTVFRVSPNGGILVTVYTFDTPVGPFRFGAAPNGGLIQAADGNFYGTTSAEYGSVYRLTPGGALTTLHQFDNGDLALYGAYLTGGLADGGDGYFYGTTSGGSGSQQFGSIFRIAADGTLAVLHPLTEAEKGIATNSLLADGTGGFYGVLPKPVYTEDAAGVPYLPPGLGGVLRFTPADGALSTVHAFVESEITKPGNRPVQGSDGKFYGIGTGGGKNDEGGVYSVTTDGVITTLYSFPYAIYRSGPLVEGRDGNFYGISGGKVFKITPAGVYSMFSGFQEGSQIVDGITLGSDGNFYGVSQNYGSSAVNTMFMITPDGTINRLHTFTAAEGGVPTSGLVQGTDGFFYGTTHTTVFKVSSTGALTVLITFKVGDGDGAVGVVFGPEGKLYGTYQHTDASTFYSLTTDGVFTNLRTADEDSTTVTFTDLIAGKDGALYGIAAGGGANRKGSLFKLADDGTQTVLYSFDGSTGSQPSFLTQASDGSFYGTTAQGGVADNGVFFKAVIPPIPTVTPTPSVPQVTVGSGQNAVVTLTLPEARADDVTVYYTVKGTAIPGVDYVALKGKAKIKAGKLSKPIKIVPLGNLGGSAKKTVKITFSPDSTYNLDSVKPIKIKLLAGGQ